MKYILFLFFSSIFASISPIEFVPGDSFIFIDIHALDPNGFFTIQFSPSNNSDHFQNYQILSLPDKNDQFYLNVIDSKTGNLIEQNIYYLPNPINYGWYVLCIQICNEVMELTLLCRNGTDTIFTYVNQNITFLEEIQGISSDNWKLNLERIANGTNADCPEMFDITSNHRKTPWFYIYIAIVTIPSLCVLIYVVYYFFQKYNLISYCKRKDGYKSLY